MDDVLVIESATNFEVNPIFRPCIRGSICQSVIIILFIGSETFPSSLMSGFLSVGLFFGWPSVCLSLIVIVI